MTDFHLSNCTLADGQSCVSCRDALLIKAQIADTEKRLVELKTDLCSMKHKINAAHCTLAKLPPEVISNIFMKFAEPTRLEAELNETWDNEFQQIPPFISRHRNDRVVHTLQLGSICHTWRLILCSTPQLWESIKVDLGHPDLSAWDIEFFNACLERSRVQPLRMSLYASFKRWKTLLNPKTLPHVMELLKSILACDTRWVELRADLPLSLMRLVQCGQSAQPKLKTLFLSFHYSRIPAALGKIFAAWDYITRVTLDTTQGMKLSLIRIHWNNVTHVTLRGFSIADYMYLLIQARGLTHLEISLHPDEPVAANFIPEHPVSHGRLRYLRATFKPDTAAALFQAKLILPALEELHLKLMNALRSTQPSDLAQIIPPSFTNPLSNMTRMSLAVYRLCAFDPHNMVDVLMTMPSIEYLELAGELWMEQDESCAYFDPFLDALTESVSAQTAFLPNLQRLYIRNTPSVSWGMLPAMWGCYDPAQEQASDSTAGISADGPHQRPLLSLLVDLVDLRSSMNPIPRNDLLLLMALINRGVTLGVRKGHCVDLIHFSMDFHGLLRPN